jgi:hypothetical protein
MNRRGKTCILILFAIYTCFTGLTAQSTAKIFMLNFMDGKYFIQVGEDNAWAFQYECPARTASQMIELDQRFFKTYKVYFKSEQDAQKAQAVVYRGEGEEPLPMTLALQAGKIYCLSASYGVTVLVMDDPAGQDSRIAFSNPTMGPPVKRFEMGKAWGKETAVFTGEVGHGRLSEFLTYKPGTYGFFAIPPFEENPGPLLDANGKPLNYAMPGGKKYFVCWYQMQDDRSLLGGVWDITPAAQAQPQNQGLVWTGQFKVEIAVKKSKQGAVWNLEVEGSRVTGTWEDDKSQDRLEGMIDGNTLKIVRFTDKEIMVYYGTLNKAKTAIEGKFQTGLASKSEGTWTLKLK